MALIGTSQQAASADVGIAWPRFATHSTTVDAAFKENS